LNTFDRYLLKRFYHVFAIGFIATYGLYVVFDAFTNADEFQGRTAGGSSGLILWRMGQHYFFQSFPFFDLIGPSLVVLAAVAVFAMLMRQSEIYPLLSAGVPTWRLAVPITVGTLSVVVMLTANQEIIIPSIADRLQAPRGTDKSSAHQVQTARDFVRNLEISGHRLFLPERRIEQAEFLLPVPELVHEPTTLRAKAAIQIPSHGNRPAGWLLRDVKQSFQDLTLTEKGRRVVFPTRSQNDMFVISDVRIDQLHNRATSFKYLSTGELVQRIRNPAYGLVSNRSQSLHLHERLTRPLLILFSVLISIPLTVRRESRGVILNAATCAGVLGVLFLVNQSSLYLGRLNIVSLDMAAWLPVLICGMCAAWLSSSLQT
jgi:lipopolysaccharide export system permease protein